MRILNSSNRLFDYVFLTVFAIAAVVVVCVCVARVSRGLVNNSAFTTVLSSECKKMNNPALLGGAGGYSAVSFATHIIPGVLCSPFPGQSVEHRSTR